MQKLDLELEKRAWEALGVDPMAEWRTIQAALGFEQAKERLEAFKTKVKKAFKRAALTHHPDHGGDEELFKALSFVIDALGKLELRPRPAPRPAVVVIRWTHGSTTSTNSSTTTSWY